MNLKDVVPTMDDLFEAERVRANAAVEFAQSTERALRIERSLRKQLFEECRELAARASKAEHELIVEKARAERVLTNAEQHARDRAMWQDYAKRMERFVFTLADRLCTAAKERDAALVHE